VSASQAKLPPIREIHGRTNSIVFESSPGDDAT
jgi:hypothetical protein